MKTNWYNGKNKITGVKLEWFLTTHTAATYQRISKYTLSRPINWAFFSNSPKCLHPNFSKISTDGFQHCKLLAEANFWLEYKQSLNCKKLLQTKKAVTKLRKWVQLKIDSEQTTQHKIFEIFLNGEHLTNLSSLKIGMEYIYSFWRNKKTTKNAQN